MEKNTNDDDRLDNYLDSFYEVPSKFNNNSSMELKGEYFETLVKEGLDHYRDYLSDYINSGTASDFPEDVENAVSEKEKLNSLIAKYDSDRGFRVSFSQFIIDNGPKRPHGGSDLNRDNVQATIHKNIDAGYIFTQQYGNGQPFNLSENKSNIIHMEKEEKSKHEFIDISGRIGADAKIIKSGEGKLGAVFTVAEKVKGQDEPKWHNVQVWEDRIKGENKQQILEGFKKGDAVSLHGYIKPEQYTYPQGHAKAGQTTTTEQFVVMDVRSHANKQAIADAQKHANNESNQVHFKGRLGTDPKIEEKEGRRIAYFSVADNKAEGGTTWHNCKAVDDYIEKAGIDKLKKGDLIEVKGFLGKEYEFTHRSGEKEGQKEMRRDVYIGETMLIKHAEEKSQDQNQSKGHGHSM